MRREPNSYGYHGDDGKKYHASGAGEDYGPKFGTGDTVGAGIHLSRREMFFTRNGGEQAGGGVALLLDKATAVAVAC